MDFSAWLHDEPRAFSQENQLCLESI